MPGTIDWPRYLARFHAEHPGITEEILRSCRHGDVDPYEWLLDGLDPRAGILDLGCGSAPARPSGPAHWLGIDRSAAELGKAATEGRGPVARADAAALPLAPSSFDVVTAAMSLMLIQPLDTVLSEIARVLRPGGHLRLLLPARSPLRAHDRLAYLRLFWAMRSITHFPPTPLRSQAATVLSSAGLEIASDETRRFQYAAHEAQAADRFVSSWYLPHTPPSRRERGRSRAARLAPFEIGVPLRRVIATRHDTPIGDPRSR